MFDTEKLTGILPELSLRHVVVVTSLFVVVYSGFTIAGNVARGYQLNAQTRLLEKQIAGDQVEYAQLDALRRYMQSDDFIEAAARQEGLGAPGDTNIIVSAPGQTAGNDPHPPPGQWWQRYFGP